MDSEGPALLPVQNYPRSASDSELSSSTAPSLTSCESPDSSATGLTQTLSLRAEIFRTHGDTVSKRQGQSENGPHDSRDGREEPMQEDMRRAGDEGWHMRHGWDSQYSAEQLRELTTNFYMYYNDKRHEAAVNSKDDPLRFATHDWRMRDRLKTVSAVLSICLNIGVDPPDVNKPNPCAKLECWIDPTATNGPPGHTPMNQIGKALQSQYEQLSMRTRYKLVLDPTIEETKKYATSLRKNAKDERILYHYNGHGVPKPTPSGEIWVFNKNYTQYIPISLMDLQSWVGAPTIFVFDCADAGLIVKNFNKLVKKHEFEDGEARNSEADAQIPNFNDCIHLAACSQGEVLPTNPQLPADLFTCCLTTPIEIAVRFFIMRNPLPSGLIPDDAAKIPGRSQERRTPIGELNWIFTAITDTIAWNSLPKPLFKKLFRQDLMVAALFRNFLLAQRIMRHYHCFPKCFPEIPSTHDHPLWKSWDLAIEMVLSQLPLLTTDENYEYQHSDFFYEQLTAFEVYLGQGAIQRKEPEQLPIVLQVLLSQVHRLRALILLSKFLDLGPWAVNLALEIGIFPYVLKLLQSQAIELKPVMVFIWARILAVDQGCQSDLLKDNGYQYFVSILNPISGEPTMNRSCPAFAKSNAPGMPIREVSEHRAMCAFIVAMFCKDFRQGQVVAHSAELVESCLSQISWQDTENPLLRQWSCLCLSMLWKDYPEAKWSGIRSSAHYRLCNLACDPVPEVRTAMLHALTTFIGIPDLTHQVCEIEEGIASRVLLMLNDGSVIVRKELVIFFSAFVVRHQTRFVVTAYEQMVEDKEEYIRGLDDGNTSTTPLTGKFYGELESVSGKTVFWSAWKSILIMSVDPDPEIARDASTIVHRILDTLVQSPLGSRSQSAMDDILRLSHQHPLATRLDLSENHRQQAYPAVSPRQQPVKQDGYFSTGLRRTASVAASLKSLVSGAVHDNLSEPLDKLTLTKSARAETISGLPHSRTSLERIFRNTKEIPSLPFRSSFFDWSVEYFREPQMKQNEADEPGSADYNGRLWRRNRNEKILESTQNLKEQAGSNRWDRDSGSFDNGDHPSRMCFHQYDSHLVITDERDTVRVWDWDKHKSLNRFSNGNPTRSKITGLRFINEDDQALLMTGSSDGVIRVFRHYESEEKNHVVSAFRALTELVPSTHNAGLVFDWLQGRGWILVAGDAKVIRVWNAATEICTSDIPARSGSCVTSLTSDQVEGNIFVAGFGDGAVRVYDQRERPTRSRVQQWKEHSQWVTNVHLQRGGQRELVSGCRNGEVKLWDIRTGRSLRTVVATKDSLRSLSVHEHAPVFATGSERHKIKVFNMDGSFLSSFAPDTSLQQNRSAPICTTAFHPHRMMLACGALDKNRVNLYSCADSKKRVIKEV